MEGANMWKEALPWFNAFFRFGYYYKSQKNTILIVI